MKKKVYVIGTCDTKGEVLRFVQSLITNQGIPCVLVDVGPLSRDAAVDITAEEVASHHPKGSDGILNHNDRGGALIAMGDALCAFLRSRDDVAGVLGMGGSGNTSVVTQGMRSLPVGVPKMMVSTIASGNTMPYVGATDIAMMYSVTDIAGINSISRLVLSNAAHAMIGMVTHTPPPGEAAEKPHIGLTMFGVTTPCVENVRAELEGDYDCLIFHATGIGGQSMEKLAESGLLAGVIDVTTTEVADFLVGGILPCTNDRFGAIARTGIPCVISCGALDMVNFGAPETIPEKFKDRLFYVHNAQNTLMRTTHEENGQFGKWIAERLNRCTGPARVLIPEKGVSAIDAPGQPFYDPGADEALFNALEEHMTQTPDHQLIRLPMHINDPEFAAELVKNYREIASAHAR